jgi:site-specific recombinase XerD
MTAIKSKSVKTDNYSKLVGHSDRNGHSFNSVSIPSAQNKTLYESHSYDHISVTVHKLLSDVNSGLTQLELALIELLFLNGLRVSEVLQINAHNITNNGSIVIKGLKGSLNRLVTPSKYMFFWIDFKKNNLSIPAYINRFYLYRLFIKKGIFIIPSDHSKKMVTHSLRHQFVYNLLNSGQTIAEIQGFLGHKSINSTIHYVSKIRSEKRLD